MGKFYKKELVNLFVFALFILTFQSKVVAQINQANEAFKSERYFDAISNYEKVLKKDPNNIAANENIAYCYRKLKNYEKAEIHYAKAVELNGSEPSNHLYYGQSLKNNGKFNEAKKQFEAFLKSNPNSLIGKLMLQSCDDVTLWEADPKEFLVEPFSKINSESSDFSPVKYKDGILFVSERGIDLVNESTDQLSGQPYLSIYFAKQSKGYEKAKPFSHQINTQFHDGPACISNDGKTMYFTRAEKNEKGAKLGNKLKIFWATLEGKKWKKITEFKYNSPTYSVAHPWISDDGNRLFFSSDMPGGFGKMDIYMCTKEIDKWGAPVNLGNEVNTAENEVFPYFRKDILYFSSDGLSGYGGLDIYSVYQSDNWKNIKNLKTQLNSSKDDFGIFFIDDENGYFSSNREGGMGKDDIYKFVYKKVINETAINGKLEYDKLPASNVGITLYDENDNELRKTVTDENGNFKFDKLKIDNNYFFRIDETDDSVLEKAKLYITNSKGEKVLLAENFAKGKYKIQTLPYEKYDELPLLEEKDESIFNIKVFGQVYQKLPGDYGEGLEILIVDENGKVIGKTRTDKDGKFVFEKLSPDQEYLFMLGEDDAGLNVIIIDEHGKIIGGTNKLGNGKFRYERLVDDKNVITLINELDEVIRISEDDTFVISKIFYDYKSAQVNEKSALELDKIVMILSKNKGIGIELTSHTDSIGSDYYNYTLSQERASSARKYIISKGINSNKITAKGLGEKEPIAPNSKPDGSDNPDGRARNRRTEIKIIKRY
ncbi:MAG: OmpA family protein [Flavobacteriales bacterium]|nr:OmpA family protein [Flavobacteriales bacterium]